MLIYCFILKSINLLSDENSSIIFVIVFWCPMLSLMIFANYLTQYCTISLNTFLKTDVNTLTKAWMNGAAFGRSKLKCYILANDYKSVTLKWYWQMSDSTIFVLIYNSKIISAVPPPLPDAYG